MRNLVLVTGFTIFAATFPVLAQDTGELVAIEARLKQSIAQVTPASVYFSDHAHGGVIVSPDGLVLTAGHCVTPGRVKSVRLPDGRKFRARGLGRETSADLGMMQILGAEDLPWVELADSTKLVEGAICFGVSYPGTSRADAAVVRLGTVISPSANDGFIQSSVAMEPGDSGGPLFDLEGRLIGIHSRIGVPMTENYEAPVAKFLAHWDELQEEETFSVWEKALDSLGLEIGSSPDENIIEVRSLEPGGAAKAAGLMVSDRILRVGGFSVSSSQSYRRRVRQLLGDDASSLLHLRVGRGSTELDIILEPIRTVTTSNTPPCVAPAQEPWPGTVPAVGDGSAVRIESRLGGERQAAWGAIVTREGRVVSKSSIVGTDPRVFDRDGRAHVAVVIHRDERRDLVLLEAPGILGATPVRFAPQSDPPEIGTLLRSPAGESWILGTVGSRPHAVIDALYLGVTIEDEDGGVVVTQLEPGFPASAAGIHVGDVLRRIDETELRTRRDLMRVMRQLDGPLELEIEVVRDGLSREFRVVPAIGGARRESGPTHAADRVRGGFSKRKSAFPSVFAHDCLVRPEQCGGPIFDLDGRCVGLTVARRSRTQCLAVPAEVLKAFVEANVGVTAEKTYY